MTYFVAVYFESLQYVWLSVAGADKTKSDAVHAVLFPHGSGMSCTVTRLPGLSGGKKDVEKYSVLGYLFQM
jgi:hypothetical protein